jgi:glucose/arabinose dehydrogenase
LAVALLPGCAESASPADGTATGSMDPASSAIASVFAAATGAGNRIRAEQVVKTGLQFPTAIASPRDGSGRMFVLERDGRIRILDRDGKLLPDPYYTRQVTTDDVEQGLLGLAFDPDFRSNGRLYIAYSGAASGERYGLVLRRLQAADPAANRFDGKDELVMRVEGLVANHNGGDIHFGPDGMLYWAVGAGTGEPADHVHASKTDNLLGKILRIDVRDAAGGEKNACGQKGGAKYAIPADNPFADPAVNPELRYARGEIWAYGLRNVWRMAFDRETGDLWAGDVGQDAWEEIDVIRRGGNYGWNLREGRHKFGPFGGEARADLVEPVWDYHHAVGKSDTGGCVYRGRAVPELRGGYLYADFVTGRIAALWVDQAMQTAIAHRQIVPGGAPVTSFGEDDEGEVYYCTQEGGLWKFAPRDGHAAAE